MNDIKNRNNTKDPSVYAIDFKKFEMKMRDGYIINGWYIKGTTRINILIFHNLNSNRTKYLNMASNFHDLGWNVIMCDLRGHGDNAIESDKIVRKMFCDGHEIIDYCCQNLLVENSKLYVIGFSIGSSIAAYNMDDERIDGIILDSGPAINIRSAYVRMWKRKGVNKPIKRFLLSFYTMYQYGLSISQGVHIKRNFRSCYKPVLFIEGKKDEFIFWKEPKMYYDMLPSEKKQFILIDDAHHLTTYINGKKEYINNIKNFINTNGGDQNE